MKRFTIKAKLLLLSVAVLAIPYVGFEYLRELERYLRDSLESSLVDAARAVAGPLHGRAELFPISREPVDRTVFVHRLEHSIQLDGYTDDWLSYLDWSIPYAEKDAARPDPLSFGFLISRHQQYFYILLRIRDERIVYPRPEAPDALENDHVVMVFTDPGGEIRRYYFSPSAPGRIRPFYFRTREDEFGFEYRSIDYITNISGVWQPVAGGYNLEIAVPVSAVGERLGFNVIDVDDTERRGESVAVGTAGEDTMRRPGRILQPSPEIESIIANLVNTEGRRIWVLDNRGQVLAGKGTLSRQFDADSVNPFYRLVLPPIHQRFRDDLSGASRLEGGEITSALSGQALGRWRQSPDGKTVIVSAAAPVRDGDDVLGAVVVEETTGGIQMRQRRAMASLFNKTLVVFVLVTGLLLLFAARLSYRLRRLGDDAEAAIDEHGRVTGRFLPSRAGDEIGELSRNYAAVLDRLKQYNEYLENMAGRLTHELRTPITVVRSSLEHLNAPGVNEQERTYLERARDGIERLNLIVTRLGEATRLEQALQSADKHQVDMVELVKNCVEGYRGAYPETIFHLSVAEGKCLQTVAPELIVQMLDKLVANAVDFSRGDRPIELSLADKNEYRELAVTNYGSRLPENMETQLFNSMVSVRGEKSGKQPHLGLGLYIVRLISEYHNARVTAENGADGESVTFRVRFPGE
ncbi:MAG: proteobacterial dedicated sortase system histidine kinase [Gammaproteobacteria bacterium]